VVDVVVGIVPGVIVGIVVSGISLWFIVFICCWCGFYGSASADSVAGQFL
ncbi:4479_t:CDS:2, partial [Gigaspora rosea]